jgi:hypothetical protein
MPGFNTIPGVAGGGGAGALNYVASIHMSTYNRSWAQAGVAGNYGVYSQNQENGYAYFVGSGMTTGVPMNRMSSISHAFTSINIVAPQGDIVSLYKTKVKATTLFSNPLAGFTQTSATLVASGSFVLPSNATVPFADIIVCGAGGGSGGGHNAAHGGGGGGGGGSVVRLTDFGIYGSTIVAVGTCLSPTTAGQRGFTGGQSSFGSVFALGGGGGGGWNENIGGTSGNGGGAQASYQFNAGGSGITQTSSNGLPASGTHTFYGGNGGGAAATHQNANAVGGGGGGSTSAGGNGATGSGGNGGTGHTSNLNGYDTVYGPGGRGGRADGHTGYGVSSQTASRLVGAGGEGHTSGTPGMGVPGGTGAVVVRFYTP